MAKKVDVYEALLQGGRPRGWRSSCGSCHLVTLLTVVAMLRASGALDLAAQALGPQCWRRWASPETVGPMVVRPISGSAALGGVGSELITTYGPDSAVGRTAAVMLGSARDHLYTIAVYFGAAGIKRTRTPSPPPCARIWRGSFCQPHGAAVLRVSGNQGRIVVQWRRQGRSRRFRPEEDIIPVFG